ncbi:MAG: hypothetical protein ACI9O4_001994 [Chitinophagales bacterium]|jgi:hypothetical protein
MEEQLAELEERIDFATANQAKYSTLFFYIEIPGGTGFDFLEELGSVDFVVIFITVFSIPCAG